MKVNCSIFRKNQSRLAILEKSALVILSLALLLWTAPANVRAADDSTNAKKTATPEPAN